MAAERWLQVDVALEGRSLTRLESARAVFGELRPLLRRWRRGKRLRRFFFMRKAPGMRLRFAGPDPRGRLLPELEDALTRLRKRGRIRRFAAREYEPEARLFGGDAAMDLVHAHFDADSSAWLELDRLWASGRSVLSPEVVTMTVMNDLFSRSVGDAGEVWDVWCNLGQLRAVRPSTARQVRIVSLADLMTLADAAERPALRDYARANRALARSLVRLGERGALSTGVRAILPFVAAFHFNRYGVRGRTQSRLIGAMMEAWRPHRGLRGY